MFSLKYMIKSRYASSLWFVVELTNVTNGLINPQILLITLEGLGLI